jgi:hypothetical protein
MALTFDEAVAEAKEFFGRYLELIDRNKSYRDDATLRGLKAQSEDGYKVLLQKAEHEREDHDALRFGLAAHLEQDGLLEPELRKWLARHLRGEVTVPADKPGEKDAVALHALMVVTVNYFYTHHGIRPTRNSSLKRENGEQSGCDAVARALASLSLEPQTFEGVKKVWLLGKKIVNFSLPEHLHIGRGPNSARTDTHD